MKETALRTYLTKHLRDAAQGRYSIVPKEEYTDAKRVDLRFHHPAVDAPVPVELKLSHSGTISEPCERLENQLCRGYLRDVRSEHGFFVVVHQGKQHSWRLPDGSTSVDFSGLLKALADHWTSIASRFPGIQDVRVLGIDLTKRAGTGVNSVRKAKDRSKDSSR